MMLLLLLRVELEETAEGEEYAEPAGVVAALRIWGAAKFFPSFPFFFSPFFLKDPKP